MVMENLSITDAAPAVVAAGFRVSVLDRLFVYS
jgi:hypothetical protein